MSAARTLCALLLCLCSCYGAADLDAQEASPLEPVTPSLPGQAPDAPGNGTTTNPPAEEVPPASTTGELPCDVAKALVTCGSCHGAQLAGGAPMPLVTYGDLIAFSKAHPSSRVIDRAIVRMTNAAAPMPPSGPAPLADVDVLMNWRAAGMPATGCEGEVIPPPPPPPPPLELVCSSDDYWSEEYDEGPQMNPGRACISCHLADEGPTFRAAGTVYPTMREPDMCRGANGATTYAGARVEVIDAAGVVYSANINASGNFSISNSTMEFPIRARVVHAGKVREMQTPQMTGDCNSCHTQDGRNGAPGRIVLP